MSSLAQLEAEYQRLVAERNALGDRYEAGEKNLLPEIKSLNATLRAIVLQIEELQGPIQSAARTAQDDALATVNQVQTPVATSQVLTSTGRITAADTDPSGSNAVKFNPQQNTDTGTNAPVRSLVNTQATNGTGTGSGIGALPGPVPTPPGGAADLGDLGEIVITASRPGAGASGDDGGTRNTTRTEIDSAFSSPIVPRPNVLDKCASYTYTASLYLMRPEAYAAMMQSKTKVLGASTLLIQSGGAPVGTGVGDPVGGQPNGSRSKFFSDDYYIDRFDLKSFVLGGGTGLSHNVTEIKLTVLEPNGITFLHNLDLAVQEFLGGADNKARNFTSQIYLLVVRFYGYDEQGNLVRGGSATTAEGQSDPNSFVEKWYPLTLTNVKFKIASKAVEYDISAVCVPYQVAAAAARATVPYNIELGGQTLQELLGGTENANVNAGRNNSTASLTTPAPQKAVAAPTVKNTVRQGLMAAMNDFQAKLVNDKVYTYPDEYSIEFASPAIAQARVVPPGTTVAKKNTSMATGGTAADRIDPNKQSMDPTTKNQSETAGMQLVQVLDQIIRNSTYVKEQQLAIVDPKTGKESPNGTPGKNVAWFKITMVAEAKLDQYDPKRNDYAYKIKYIVSAYKINQLFSPWFPTPKFDGVHKSYNYWFTGQNVAVLNYEENLNALYYIAMTNNNLNNATSSYNELIKRYFQTRSNESSQGSKGRTNEPAASAADQLYSPSDLKEATVTIVGDPAWLQQGEAFVASDAANWNFNPFLPDGTINFDSQQILFEIAFNTPRDYDFNTGIMDVNNTTPGALPSPNSKYGVTSGAKISRVYIAKSVDSEFNKGRFVQTLKGALLIDYEAAQKGDQRAEDPRTVEITPVNAVAVPPKQPRSSVTDPTPTSSIAKGVQQILNPPTQLNNPTLAQLQASPVYIAARRAGDTPAVALTKAQAAFAAGTNNTSGTALPGIRVPGQRLVKDGNPG